MSVRSRIFFQLSAVFLLSSSFHVQTVQGLPSGVPREAFEHRDYRVIFRGTTRGFQSPEGAFPSYREMVYKISLITDSPDPLFGAEGVAELRFLDSDGYILASDLVARDDLFIQKEYYAKLWIEKDKIAHIQDARLLAVQGEALAQARQRFVIRNREIQTRLRLVKPEWAGESSEIALPEKAFQSRYAEEFRRSQALLSIDENLAAVREKLSVTPPPVEAPQASVSSPAPAPDLKNSDEETISSQAESEGPSGAPRLTNEDIAKVLKEHDGNRSDSEDSSPAEGGENEGEGE